MSQTAPPLTAAEIQNYPINRSWEDLFERSINHPSDDGHLAKCVRSLAYGEKVLGNRDGGEGEDAAMQLRGDDWLRLANLGECNLAVCRLQRTY